MVEGVFEMDDLVEKIIKKFEQSSIFHERLKKPNRIVGKTISSGFILLWSEEKNTFSLEILKEADPKVLDLISSVLKVEHGGPQMHREGTDFERRLVTWDLSLRLN